MHVETITFAAFLMGLLWSSQFNGTASLSSIPSRTARNGCNGFSDIVKKKMLVNKKDRAKSSRYVQSVSGCHDFKCQVLIWADSKLSRRHVRLCKTKRR